MKRSIDDPVSPLKRQKSLPRDLLLGLPLEVVEIIIQKGRLSNKDVIGISSLSSLHRIRYFPLVFRHLKLTWDDFKRFDETFKTKDLVNSLRIYSDLADPKKTNFGEWNISLRDILLKCAHLTDLTLEVMTSARCLKYQDQFDVDLSDKIKSLKLISHAHEAADESLFELSQLQKFHLLTSLTLNGFFISKDQYFYPKYKPDLSDFQVRSLDGKLVYLEHLKLVDCRWEHPYNLSDIFCPAYPSPNPILFDGQAKFTAPTTLELFYSDESSSFVVTERFQSLINNEVDEQFLFQTRFYSQLRHLSLVVLNKNPKYDYYHPWIAQMNLKRKYQAPAKDTGEIETRSILTSLETLELVGWRLASIQELNTVFEVDLDMHYNMKHVSLYLMKSAMESHQLEHVKERLDAIFNAPGRNNDHCRIEVGYADECLADGRYERDFTKMH